MSSPVHQPKDLDAALRYAPPWARGDEARGTPLAPEAMRGAPQVPAEARGAPQAPEEARPVLLMRDTAQAAPLAPDAARTTPAMPAAAAIEWPPRRRDAGRAFSGDLAVIELQRHLALDPEKVPAPVPLAGDRTGGMIVLRLSAVTGIAALVAWAVVSLPGVLHGRTATAVSRLATAAMGGGKHDLLAAMPPMPTVRLAVHDSRAEVNEPLPAGIELKGSAAGATVFFYGLVPDTRLSAGTQVGTSGWRVDARDLDRLLIRAPRDFVGAVDAKIDLRLADNRIADTQTLRYEWMRPAKPAEPPPVASVPKPAPRHADSPVVRLDDAEITALIKRGEDFLRSGDLASARLLLRRAAEAGSADAALALGETFDPLYVEQLGAIGIKPDPALAREWYQKAAELGSDTARQQLAKLAQAHE